MFDEYKILEYLLDKAYRQCRIPYDKIYRYFDVSLDDNYDDEVEYEDKKSVTNFLNMLERAERRIVKEVMTEDIIPIYSIILYRRRDKLPGIGFYDIFYNRNRKEYRRIAGSLIVQDAFKNYKIKKQIYDIGIEALKKDLKERFPNQESVNNFINEIKIYRDI
ncbi:hypothetical protein A7H1H_1160 [Aliarcobacter butzleri 7h1h]|uniref:Uncharacterized protein n=1 Tax=Aliarcobacter butzleri L352 TaxID=1447260 RepID=A0A837JE59_9BACT|nr:hypothetical protein [Aliarcobacter butzleri]AGR77460.1 hypothetical protein A7H1H_1160 [Aliarcobacter butzleri 7h1h]KLE06493.1 hypothetical protein AF77_01595 [Aliarcobacter butzleri L352]MDN5092194.1 hypothetical protein [Aliarcobacter butzleri]